MYIKGYLKYYLKDRLVLLVKAMQLRFWKNEPPVLVHTMAKVGSLSIYFSLLKTNFKRAYFHTHELDQEKAILAVDSTLKKGIFPGSRTPVPLIWNEILNKKRSYQIITLVRDPLERNISAFFEAFELYVGIPAHQYEGSLAQLEKIYHEELPHDYVLKWMDEKLKPFTGIDLYQHPFNQKEGHMVYQKENLSILVLYSSITDPQKEKLISEFTHLPNFKMSNRNVTSQTSAGQLYTEFKNAVKFEEEYLNVLYDSKYAKHFFSEDYRQMAKLRWKK